MSISLYKATELARIESHVDPETGEVDIVSFDKSQIALAEKQRAVVAFMKNQSLMIGMLKQAESDIAEKRRIIERRSEGLKSYLMNMMLESGTSEIEALDGTFRAKLYLNRDSSVAIEDGATFPPGLCNDPMPPAPSMTKIREAIESGEVVFGASIVKKHRLEIK